MIEGIELTWLGHASVKVKGDGKVVYIDPWKLSGSSPETADLVLVTHPHFDHCSPDDVAKVSGDRTQLVSVRDCVDELSGDVTVVAPGQSVTVGGLEVEAVPAYNVGKSFHPKENGWVGFVVTFGGNRIYHTGDTDVIPEMSDVVCDLALLPCGGKYTMDADEAAQAANTLSPQLAVPMHFGDVVGSEADAERFRSLCRCEVEILQPGQP